MFNCLNGDCDEGVKTCCRECGKFETCGNSCNMNPESCGASVDVESTDLTVFQSKALAVMQSIVELDKQKKDLEVKDKKVRKQLADIMDQYGVKKFENDFLSIVYVEPTTKSTIDSTRLKKELPEIADRYKKISQVKGFVRIEVK